MGNGLQLNTLRCQTLHGRLESIRNLNVSVNLS